MATHREHPFYSEAVTHEILTAIQKPLSSQQQQNLQKLHPHQDLIDLLSWKETHSHFLHSTDSSLSITSHSVFNDDFNRLKYLIRSVLWPINHSIRRQLWMNISTLNRVSGFRPHRHIRHVSQTAMTSTSMIIDNTINSLPSTYNQWPKFVDPTNLCFYHLNESRGRTLLHRIVSAFAIDHPDITYCPVILPFAALLLHYCNEYEVLYLINRLLVRSWLCGETRVQWDAHCHVFKKLFRLYYKSAADVIDSRVENTHDFYHEWFWWIFRYLPFFYIVKIMDCFLLEGPKLLFRISLTLAHLYEKRIKRQPHENDLSMAAFCQQIPVSLDQLLDIAVRIRNFKRRTMDQLIKHEERLLRSTRYQSLHDESKQNNSGSNTVNVSDRNVLLVTSQHLTEIPQKSILTREQFLTLWNWLPVRLSISQPMLVFTTAEDGFRLQTLVNKIDELEHSLLIVKATNGQIFGAFCAGLWSDRQHRTYFGFGESFLFTLAPKQTRYAWVGQQPTDTNRQAQAKREMFLFANHEKLIIGGGNGDGLCIDQSLCEGYTTHCDTFDNEPLCEQSYFSISVLEMFAFDFSSS